MKTSKGMEGSTEDPAVIQSMGPWDIRGWDERMFFNYFKRTPTCSTEKKSATNADETMM